MDIYWCLCNIFCGTPNCFFSRRKDLYYELCIKNNGISINNSKHLVLLNNKKISLTKKQFQILTLLYNDNDVVYSREQIIQKVWDKDYYVTHRNVDVQIRKIRELIGHDKITTIKGLGYKFSSD